MARQANGNYLQPANTAAVSGSTISSSAFNTLITDIGTEITNSLDRGGRSAMTAALPMGSNKITGMAEPTVSTDAATKNYVDTTTAAFFSTGDVKLTLKVIADAGWLMMNDSSIGPVGSGAGYQNANAQALYNLLWTNLPDAYATVVGGRGVSAAADWAGLKAIGLTKVLGRALAVSGAGAGLGSTYALGQTAGSASVTLTTANLPPYTPSGTITNGAITNTQTGANVVLVNVNGSLFNSGGGNYAFTAVNMASSYSQATTTFSGTAQGGTSAPVSITPPTAYMNVMIKL